MADLMSLTTTDNIDNISAIVSTSRSGCRLIVVGKNIHLVKGIMTAIVFAFITDKVLPYKTRVITRIL